MIYLDYNATSPLRPEVKSAMLTHDEALNPSSIHAAGRAARKIKEDARKEILQFINADSLVFCSSGTEANNLALAQVPSSKLQDSSLIISSVEHDSIYKAVSNAIKIEVDLDGIIDLNNLERILLELGTSNLKLVSIILANNETGVIQPIKEAAELCHKYGALIHTDAVQAFGKIPLDFKNLGVDLMTISAHKVGGPAGIAALVFRKDLELKPILVGGGQELNKRPGTENMLGIIGFAAVTKLLGEAVAEPAMSVRSTVPSEVQENRRETSKENVPRETFIDLRNFLESEIKKICPEIFIYSENANRLPNTSCIAMPGVANATQLIAFDSAGICVSSGSACSSGKVEVSRVLKEINPSHAADAIRISLGWKTQKTEIERFCKEWEGVYKKTLNRAA